MVGPTSRQLIQDISSGCTRHLTPTPSVDMSHGSLLTHQDTRPAAMLRMRSPPSMSSVTTGALSGPRWAPCTPSGGGGAGAFRPPHMLHTCPHEHTSPHAPHWRPPHGGPAGDKAAEGVGGTVQRQGGRSLCAVQKGRQWGRPCTRVWGYQRRQASNHRLWEVRSADPQGPRTIARNFTHTPFSFQTRQDTHKHSHVNKKK